MNDDPHASDLETSPFALDDSAVATETAPARPHVERVEPLPSGKIFGPEGVSALLGQFLLKGVSDPKTAIHPFGGMCKACLGKEPPVETRLPVLWRQFDHPLAPGWFPVNCCDRCYEEAMIDTDRLKANRQFWETVCPIEFRKDWDNRKGDAKFLSRVLGFEMKLKRGLLIHGASDSAKTRAVWRLLRKLSEDGVSWLFIESIDLLDNIPAEAFNCQLLVIDDLGNDQLTGPKEVRFLKLIRTRCNWHRPFIVTTQFNGDALSKKFGQTATAVAVIRRMREFCDQIESKPFANP